MERSLFWLRLKAALRNLRIALATPTDFGWIRLDGCCGRLPLAAFVFHLGLKSDR
jgi:hypothetical protein